MDLGGIDLSSNKEKEDRRLEHNEKVALEMMRRKNEYQCVEPITEEGEKALFDSFWAKIPDVNLSDPQKELAFDLFWHGYTLTEMSGKYGKAVQTLSDWKQKIEIEVRRAYKNKEQ